MFVVIFLSMLNCRTVDCLKCYHCNVNNPNPNSFHISCDYPAQRHCSGLADTCIKLVYNSKWFAVTCGLNN
jgi:hypothetical protein